MPWPAYQGKPTPNLYAILAGPPGNLKSTSIYPAGSIAKGVLDKMRFLQHNYSPEGLFDSFFNHPDQRGCKCGCVSLNHENIGWPRKDKRPLGRVAGQHSGK